MNEIPPINPWPPPRPGKKPGPSAVQKPLFIYHYPLNERPHNHEMDVCLMVGGSGSGKSTASIAQVVELVAGFPGVKAVVGGKNYPLIKRNVLSEFAQRFSIGGKDWDHPIVGKRPTQTDMVMVTKDWHGKSKLSFLNLDRYAVARGFDADVVMIEEVNLMDAPSFEEMIRRSRGRALPVVQFILSMNPTGDRDWLYYKFNMKQFEPSYSGPPIPIGDPCRCQFCPDCLNISKEEVRWEGGELLKADYTDSNGILHPDRPYSWLGAKCPKCGNSKTNYCPGNQYYYRVIRSKSYDNPHNRDSYTSDMRGAMSKEKAALFIDGEIIQTKTGKVYKSFGSHNILDENIEINYEKDVIWTHDFNQDPMCSVLWQETSNGIHVFDEIIEWDANEEKVARAFVDKFQKCYPNFNNWILIYGDPAGLNGASRTETRRTSFQIIADYLTSKGYKVQIMTEKIKGETKIYIKDRVNNVDTMLLNANNEVRVKINPRAVGLINSLSSIVWDDDGKEEDKKVDEQAKNVSDKEINVPIMTHPSCAFGYAVVKRFDMLRKAQPFQVLITDREIITSDEKGVISKTENIASTKLISDQVIGSEKPKTFLGMASIPNYNLNERVKHEKQKLDDYERSLLEKLRKRNALS